MTFFFQFLKFKYIGHNFTGKKKENYEIPLAQEDLCNKFSLAVMPQFNNVFTVVLPPMFTPNNIKPCYTDW